MQQHLDTVVAVAQQVLVAPLDMLVATAHLEEAVAVVAVQVRQVPAAQEAPVDPVLHE
jgi:hypothetical protein